MAAFIETLPSNSESREVDMKHVVSERLRLCILGMLAMFAVVVSVNMDRYREEARGGTALRFEIFASIPFENKVPDEKAGKSREPVNNRARQEAQLATSLQESYKIGRDRARKFAAWILEAHMKSGVPVGHIAALLATESSFRYQARSHVGAIGPAQVVPRYWSDFCQGSLDDPDANVICGARVLAHYRESCPDWRCAFQKYNVGPRGYRDPKNAGAIKRYIAKIQSHQAQLRAGSAIN